MELLIAIGILATVIGSTAVVVLGNQSLFIDKRLSARAVGLASEGLEAVKSISLRSWNDLAPGQYGLALTNNQWQFSGTQDVTDIFTRTIQITAPETNVYEIKSAVSWLGYPARSLKIELAMRLANWRGLFGDWNNPRTLGSVDLGPGNSATDLKVSQKIVYMTAEASAAAKPDFFIIDATDGAMPGIVSSLNTGPGMNSLDLDFYGKFAYIANQSDANQLQIIDITNISAPSLITSYKLPGNSEEGLSIFALGNYVYLGTEDSENGREFHVVDVSNPSAPQSVGSLEISDDVNAIHVQNNYAYLATAYSSELLILDVSNPTSPTLAGQYDASGNSEDGRAVYIIGSKLYLGRLLGGVSAANHELHILSVSDPVNPVNLGSQNFSSSIIDLISRDYLLFLATNNSNEEFQVWNISNPTSLTKISGFNFPQVATGIDYENNLVYVSVRSNDALRIITSQ